MDALSHELSYGYSILLEDLRDNRGQGHQHELLEMQCIICQRTFIPWIEVNEGLDAMGLCRECKTFVVDDNEIGFTARNYSGRQSRRRPRYGSSESVESAFSQLIGFSRQNLESQLDDDSSASIPSRQNYTHRFSSRSVRRALSDTDNESTDIMDSLFGETDSHISFGGYGGDSDASVDGRSMIDREILSPLDDGSRVHTDTDMDPMHAGLDQWTSDDQGEYETWDEFSVMEASMQLTEQHGRIQDTNNSNESATNPQNGAWIHWRAQHSDIFTDAEEIDLSPFTGNSGDYMDAQGFEELLEQLAEADNSRRGAPPAAVSSVRCLPSVIITKDHEKNGILVCAVCKDALSIDTEANQLPCSHLYHPSCILPWLRTRNSCPVCRYELPTDDPEYEEGKHNNLRNVIHEIRQQELISESYSDESAADENNDHDLYTGDDPGIHGSVDAVGSSRHDGNRRWLLIAAAPIVTIVGVAIAAWLRNSMVRGRIYHGVRDHEMNQSQRFHGAMVHSNRNKRWWWSPF